MAYSYTPNLRLTQPSTGSDVNVWGDTLNAQVTAFVDSAIAGAVTIASWTANSHTLTTINGGIDEARMAILIVTTGNATAATTVICPANTKIYTVRNDSAYNTTIKTASGTGFLIPAGRTATVYCNPLGNIYPATEAISNLYVSGGIVFDGLTAGSIPYLNGSKQLVASTALTYDANGLKTVYKEITNALSGSVIDLNIGNYFTLTVSGSTTLTVSNVSTGATVSSFILDVTNAGTLLSFGFTTRWQGGAQPTLSASGRDIIGFFTNNGGTSWVGMLIAKGVA